MCGICGIATTRGAVDPGRLAQMSATLVHRGPDSDGSHLAEGIGLAARRLAIIDLATGDQPIASEDGRITVVQNGELYNYRELRHELERAGHRFSTSGDRASSSIPTASGSMPATSSISPTVTLIS